MVCWPRLGCLRPRTKRAARVPARVLVRVLVRVPGQGRVLSASRARAAYLSASRAVARCGAWKYPGGTRRPAAATTPWPARAVVALYSVIHLGPGELPAACAEMHRVLRPGGLALVSFHIGSEVRHFAEWWGHEVDLDFRFLETPEVAQVMEEAGLTVEARLERTSYPGEVDTRRAYLLGRRGGGAR